LLYIIFVRGGREGGRGRERENEREHKCTQECSDIQIHCVVGIALGPGNRVVMKKSDFSLPSEASKLSGENTLKDNPKL